MKSISRLLVGGAIAVAAFAATRVLWADNGSSGCDGSVAPNGALSCIPNEDCDDGCQQIRLPGGILLPPKGPGWVVIMCDCLDPWFGEEDICTASTIWNENNVPPTYEGTVCLTDDGESCPSEDECHILPGPPTICRCY